MTAGVCLSWPVIASDAGVTLWHVDMAWLEEKQLHVTNPFSAAADCFSSFWALIIFLAFGKVKDPDTNFIRGDKPTYFIRNHDAFSWGGIILFGVVVGDFVLAADEWISWGGTILFGVVVGGFVLLAAADEWICDVLLLIVALKKI
jgi:hypothetical protein